MGTHERERESHIPSRRQALHIIGFSGLAAAVPASIVALAAAPDPIFSCIAEHKRLMGQVRACYTPCDGEDRLAELVDIADEHFGELLTTVPTTLPGLIAWVSHIRHDCDRLGLAYYETRGGVNEEELFLDTLTAALSHLAGEVRA